VSDPVESDENAENAVRRALDILVFAPVGVALTVIEDLPGLIVKGRARFETDVRNARVIGQFVVNSSLGRVGKLFHTGSSDTESGSGSGSGSASASASTSKFESSASVSHAPESDATGSGSPVANVTPSSATNLPKPDPADAIIVEAALAGYDTLSASQVVRRLESLGPLELHAVARHEASHRNRRTILNRAHQLLDAGGVG
jgi:hypothetical protein